MCSLTLFCLPFNFQLQFWYVLPFVCSSFEIILKRKRELVALLLLSYICLVTVNVLLPFFTVPWVGLQCVIVVFPDHTHLRFNFDFRKVWRQGSCHVNKVLMVLNWCPVMSVIVSIRPR